MAFPLIALHEHRKTSNTIEKSIRYLASVKAERLTINTWRWPQLVVHNSLMSSIVTLLIDFMYTFKLKLIDLVRPAQLVELLQYCPSLVTLGLNVYSIDDSKPPSSEDISPPSHRLQALVINLRYSQGATQAIQSLSPLFRAVRPVELHLLELGPDHSIGTLNDILSELGNTLEHLTLGWAPCHSESTLDPFARLEMKNSRRLQSLFIIGRGATNRFARIVCDLLTRHPYPSLAFFGFQECDNMLMLDFPYFEHRLRHVQPLSMMLCTYPMRRHRDAVQRYLATYQGRHKWLLLESDGDWLGYACSLARHASSSRP